MKKGKKMPSIELEGHSDARFVLKDGKIVRVEQQPQQPPTADRELRGPEGPHGPR